MQEVAVFRQTLQFFPPFPQNVFISQKNFHKGIVFRQIFDNPKFREGICLFIPFLCHFFCLLFLVPGFSFSICVFFVDLSCRPITQPYSHFTFSAFISISNILVSFSLSATKPLQIMTWLGLLLTVYRTLPASYSMVPSPTPPPQRLMFSHSTARLAYHSAL